VCSSDLGEEITAHWNGTGGGTGYTRLRYAGGLSPAGVTAAYTSMRSFLSSFTAYLPNAVTISFEGLAQLFDDAGHLTQEISVTPPSQVVGTGGTSWASPVGAIVSWETGVFNARGHRVRGRTYLVPLASNAYDAQGTLQGATITAIAGGANPLATSLVVVSRNDAGAVTAVTPVSAATIPDKACILRSRRD
jgi:hypothetical protein